MKFELLSSNTLKLKYMFRNIRIRPNDFELKAKLIWSQSYQNLYFLFSDFSINLSYFITLENILQLL
jgi:hypothetical protein